MKYVHIYCTGAPLYATSGPSGRVGGFAAGIAKSLSNYLPMAGATSPSSVATAQVDPLFYVLYENRPFSTPKVDFKLHLR